MKRFRILGLALVAVFALGAMAAGSAQAVTAPFFSIGGKRLPAGSTHNIDARAVKNFILETPGLVRIECTTLTAEKGVLLGSNEGQPGKDNEITTFSGCKQTGLGEKCTVVEPIKTHPLTSELVENEANRNQLLEEFRPTTGSEFVTLHFEGECAVNEATVTGAVAAEVVTDNKAEEKIELGQTPKEATSWLLRFPTTPISAVLLINTKGTVETAKLKLEFATLESSLTGTALTLLANTKFESERQQNWSPLP